MFKKHWEKVFLTRQHLLLKKAKLLLKKKEVCNTILYMISSKKILSNSCFKQEFFYIKITNQDSLLIGYFII